ncbi:MAG: M48 family peptidase [Dehalococcoidia bacterium]|nr:MAG: M48 family peptidase [Dehalococcoidia bacterium]
MTEHGEVAFGNARIRYSVVRSPRRHKTIEVTVEQPGLVTVAVPEGTASERIEATVQRRAGWIVRHDGATTTPPSPRRFVSGESLPYFGRSVRMFVHPVDGGDVRIRFHHWQFDVDVPRSLVGEQRYDVIRSAFERWYRVRAQDRLPARVDRVARLLGVNPTAILVRDQRQRWASCSPSGTLRFNWRALMAPPALLDYVVAHELAHLRVRAHTTEYWAAVAQAIPDYRQRRERLRDVGPLLVI